MKKALIYSLLVMFTASTAAIAGPLGDWAQQTADKINKKEAEAVKPLTEKQEAYKKQQEQARLERERQQAEQQRKREAAQRKIEHKKKLWNELISE